jgi:glutamate dehydrogenase
VIGPGDEVARAESVAERLRTLLARVGSAGEAAQLAVFARLLLARAEPYVERLGADAAAAMVASAFRFYAGPGPDVRVRATTPDYPSEGWEAPVSVLETAMPDRPFVVDTIRERLARLGVAPEAFLHPIFAARRDETGRLVFLAPPEGLDARESCTHVALPHTTDAALLARIADDVRAGLADVRLVTDDFELMLARCRALATELDVLARQRTLGRTGEAAVAAELIRWLADGAFIFLGYREYVVVSGDGGVPRVQVRPGSGLGLLRREARSAFATPQPVDALSPWARTRLGGASLVTVGRSLAESPVHRRARMDDVAVVALDASGRVTGLRRFLGLFTSKAHAEEAAELPFLRPLLQRVLAAEQVVPGSHDYKTIVALFNALPKAHLLASSAPELCAEMRALLEAQRGADPVVSVHAVPEAERTAVAVVLPRARFSSAARQRLRDVLQVWLGGVLLDDHLALGEGDRALLHFTFARAAALPDEGALGEAVAAILRTWPERLRDELLERHGVEEGEGLAARFATAFPEDYAATTPVERAAEDVVQLARVAREAAPRIVVRTEPRGTATALRLYLPDAPLVLSECLPLFEHLGLRTLGEDQVVVRPPAGGTFALQTFTVQDRQGRPLPEAAGPPLAEAILALRAGRAESDVLNRLVLDAGLDWRAVHVLRAYAAYGVQAGLAARPVVLGALAEHPGPARLLFAVFDARFRPPGNAVAAAAHRQEFLQSLDGVASLRDDLVLRGLLATIEATVRTTFFTRPPDVDHVAMKLRSADVPHLPPPRPLYEVWVHAPTTEGIHLRAGRVARGGIRASDRPDDFRTEVLGLMKTQTVKNAVIVPTGAKGGFVVKRGAVLDAYRTFVRGLLDLTDNRVGPRTVHPPGVVVYDDEDPYLVVAADKGTATFSDVANALAVERAFWLGDAFASGGSHGYDHKALGITARGVWECGRTHFRVRGVDADTAPLTVAGIGDMSGDVFGNGLLRSPHLRLLAAFDHLHVFIDPDPDPARSFAERERLFAARAGWDAYDPAVLSPGGMVVPRAAKRVALSAEARHLLGLGEDEVSGEALVRAVLGLHVDLLYNGGIGTYVAATGETDVEVHDAANDAVRVKADAVQARVVAEGGNLGFTQRARIEYALAGGRIDTDAVDNSAGVDLSDHEVNLKICLQAAVDAGRLGGEARNALLAGVTDDVVGRVLGHNRAQSRMLGLDQLRSRTRLEDFRELQAELERAAGLDRALERLPDRETLRARRGQFLGLTRPELAVLMAWAKLHLQHALRAAALLDEPIVVPWLVGYFPALVAERFPEAIVGHPLRREIVATELANLIVDELGAGFVVRLERDTGVPAAEVVRAFTVAWAIVGGPELRAAIAAGAHPADVDAACAFALERTCGRVTKWIVANGDPARPAAALAAELAQAVDRVRGRLPEWVAGAEAEAYQRSLAALEMAGLPTALARALANGDWLPGVLDVLAVAAEAGVEPERAAACYFGLAQHVDFAWVAAHLDRAATEDRWQRRAVEGLTEDLLRARRGLARAMLAGGGAPPARQLTAVQDLLRDLGAAPRVGVAALAVVVREIRRLEAAWSGRWP